MVTVSINAFTSVFSGFVVFAFLGYIAYKSDLPIDKVVAEGTTQFSSILESL